MRKRTDPFRDFLSQVSLCGTCSGSLTTGGFRFLGSTPVFSRAAPTASHAAYGGRRSARLARRTVLVVCGRPVLRPAGVSRPVARFSTWTSSGSPHRVFLPNLCYLQRLQNKKESPDTGARPVSRPDLQFGTIPHRSDRPETIRPFARSQKTPMSLRLAIGRRSLLCLPCLPPRAHLGLPV